MREWMDNGARLGWLLDAERGTASIYRPGREPEKGLSPKKLKGEGPVEGFVLDLAGIWDPEL